MQLHTYLCLFIREHLYIYKIVTHISHLHQHEGIRAGPPTAVPVPTPLRARCSRWQGGGHILHPHCLPQETVV